MVLLGRIELPTSALPRMRSTTELQQHTIPKGPGGPCRPDRGALLAGGPAFVNLCLRQKLELGGASRQDGAMPDRSAPPAPPQTREDRLAAKLRENLHRRKQQAREMAQESNPALPKAGSTS